MPYIVDGHNLIPHIPGINLADLEDEKELINLLGKFSSQRRTRIEVYFDQAPPTRDRRQSSGLVTAHFIRAGSTADQAIKTRLSRLGKAAKNWTVVSSDREILVEARSHHCSVIKSPEFARTLTQAAPPRVSGDEKTDQPEVSDSEVDYWMDQFNSD